MELDGNGWANVDDLIVKAPFPLTRDVLEDVVATCDKQRFALSEDGTRIRANQGHSVKVDLALAPKAPPPTLFHGTVDRFMPAIMAEGLKPMKRSHVHLSADIETARIVGKRRGAPIILEVASGAMADAGQSFFQAENGVWLTAHVPAGALKKL